MMLSCSGEYGPECAGLQQDTAQRIYYVQETTIGLALTVLFAFP